MKKVFRLLPLFVLLLACNLATPTATPMPACTPPPCSADEVYYCPDDCPGGCGTTCATPTATAAEPEVVCTILPCSPGEVYYCPNECVEPCEMTCVTPSPTAAEPQPVCTPPPCSADEVYYCPDECPGGCGTICATPTPSAEIPTENMPLYDGCAFEANYPPELPPDGGGWFVFFHPTTNENVYLSIQARQETGVTAEEAADALVAEIFGAPASIRYVQVDVTDWNGQTLKGVQADLTADGDNIRLLVVVRPETMLGNLSPDDVVYELVARAPAGEWLEWQPFFFAIMDSFRPRDCGGV